MAEHAVNQAALNNAGLYTTRLEDDEIRLLYLEQPLGKWSFQKHKISEARDYVAVSYTWGPNEDTAYAGDDVISKEGVPRYLSAVDTNYDNNDGDETPYYLEIDGKNYQITRNVHELATRVISDEGGALAWVDALCINQADVVERSAQVARMGDIFSNAEYVLVWLGTDDDDEAGSVIELCKAISAEYERQTDGGGRIAAPRHVSNIMEPGTLEGMGLPPASDERWYAFARFWDRRWFHRLWIVQEATMASSPRMWWGGSELDTRMLGNVSSFILQAEFPLATWRTQFNKTGTKEWWNLRRKMGETLTKIRASKFVVYPEPDEVDNQPYQQDSYILQCDTVGGPRMLDGKVRQDSMRHYANILETHRTFDATDPRDYIYGTLGIIESAAANRGWTPTGIQVDYTKSVADIYGDAAKRIMETSRCINLLSLAQDPLMRKQHDLPSWVPDFSARGVMPVLLPKARRWETMPKLYNLSQSIAASRSHVFEVQDNLRVLKVKAICLTDIKKIGESHHELCNGGIWEQVAQILISQPSFVKGESQVESLWRSLIANTSLDGYEIAPPETAKLFKYFVATSLVMNVLNDPNHLDKLPTWRMVTELDHKAANYDEEAAALYSFDWVREKAGVASQDVQDIEAGNRPAQQPGPIMSQAALFANNTQPMYYRRVLLTSCGLLGFGPLSTKPGDEVWVLPGMPLPTVLRRTEAGAYRVLGETYLHGDPDFPSGGEKEMTWIDLV